MINNFLKRHSFVNRAIIYFLSVLSLTFANFGSAVAQDTTKSITFENTYQYSDAKEYNLANYDWWVDEDSNNIANVPAELNSPYGYGYRNCTDGVAKWIDNLFHQNISGWGDAKNWDESAAGTFTVKAGNSNSIEQGDIAQSDSGDFGHVGLVTSVTTNSLGMVTKIKVAELNKLSTGDYSLTEYSTKINGKFKRNNSSPNKYWDHFIDIDGPNTADTPITQTPASLPQLPGASMVSYEGSLYAFARGINNELYKSSWTGAGWTGFQTMQEGAVFKGGAKAVEYNGTLYIFARGVDDEIYKNQLTDDGWTGFSKLQNGAIFSGDPAIAQYGSALGVYAKGVNGEVYANSLDGAGWTGFNSIQPGAVFEGDPSAISFSNSMYIFARGIDDAIYRTAWTGAGWTGFVDSQPGATFSGDPTLVQYQSALGVFAKGVDNQIYNNSLDGAGWTGYQNIHPGTYFKGNPAAASYNNKLYIIGRGIDDELYRNIYTGAGWTGFQTMQQGAILQSDPVAVQFESALGVFALGTNGEVYSNSLDGAGWTGFNSIQPGAVFEDL